MIDRAPQLQATTVAVLGSVDVALAGGLQDVLVRELQAARRSHIGLLFAGGCGGAPAAAGSPGANHQFVQAEFYNLSEY